MLKTEKQAVVEQLTERLKTSETLIVADYRGLTNKQIDGIRDELFKHGARFSVAKNTLARRAAEAAGSTALLELLEGPTAIAFVQLGGDPVAVAKVLNDAVRTTKVLSIRGGVLQGKTIGEDAVKSLATLPPADVLRGQVLGAMVAPLTTFVALINAPLQNLIGLIDARVEQLGGAAPEPEAAAPVVEAPVEEPQPEGTAEVPAEVAAEAPEAAAEPAPEAAGDPTDTETIEKES